MQFNIVLRTGGLAINMEEFKEKEGDDGIILTVLGLTLLSALRNVFRLPGFWSVSGRLGASGEFTYLSRLQTLCLSSIDACSSLGWGWSFGIRIYQSLVFGGRSRDIFRCLLLLHKCTPHPTVRMGKRAALG